MIARRFRFVLLTVLILVGLLGQPVPVQAQCSVTNTSVMTFGTIMVVYKFLNNSYNCGTTMMNALFCNPTAMTGTNFLHASAAAATMSPSCAWMCTGTGGGTCANITIDSSDNLPVELMEFSVEDGDAVGAAGEGGQETTGEGGEESEDKEAR